MRSFGLVVLIGLAGCCERREDVACYIVHRSRAADCRSVACRSHATGGARATVATSSASQAQTADALSNALGY